MEFRRYASLVKEKLNTSVGWRANFKESEGVSGRMNEQLDWKTCATESDELIAEDLPLRLNAGPQEHLGWLMQTIESSVIPRLLVTHLADQETNSTPSNSSNLKIRLTDPDGVAQLTRLLLEDDATKSAEFVRNLYTSGIPLDDVYLNLLAPAARMLGVMWEDDEVTFTQVTTSLWRIKQLVYDFSPLFQEFARADSSAPHAMLVPMPGSQHTLGLFMVSEFFRRGGWKVWGELAADHGEIITALKTQHFDLVGISISVEEQLPALSRFIELIRNESMNPNLGIMVGGPIFNQKPELTAQVGADIVGVDAEKALVEAEILLEQLRQKK
jgi:methanogenic corrinoid protein MtbC1